MIQPAKRPLSELRRQRSCVRTQVAAAVAIPQTLVASPPLRCPPRHPAQLQLPVQLEVSKNSQLQQNFCPAFTFHCGVSPHSLTTTHAGLSLCACMCTASLFFLYHLLKLLAKPVVNTCTASTLKFTMFRSMLFSLR